MKFPSDMTNWHRCADGIWLKRYRRKKKKNKSYWGHRYYYEITCEYCGVLALGLVVGGGRFCSNRCAYRSKNARGANNPHWKGGRRIDDQGYVELLKPHYPRANKGGYVQEHIVVLEKKLGRSLRAGEVTHHTNRNKTDNRPENLVAMTRDEHSQIHKALRRGNATMYDAEALLCLEGCL